MGRSNDKGMGRGRSVRMGREETMESAGGERTGVGMEVGERIEREEGRGERG